ncbi:unnamed protein product, partial [Polarella glacialis]
MAARIQQHPAAFVGAAVVVGGSLVAPGVTAWVSAARGGAPNLRDGRQNAVRYGVTVEDRLSLGTASPAASSSRAGEALLVGIAGLSLAARAAAKKRRSGVSRRVVASRWPCFCTTCLALGLGGSPLAAGDSVDFSYAIYNKGTVPLEVYKATPVFTLESAGFALCQEDDGVVSCDTVFGWPLHADDIDRALHAHLYGESTWAGDRDVRFLNCLVPCQFSCNRSVGLGFSQTWAHKKLLEAADLGGRVDLLPQGQQNYTANLTAMLGRLQKRLGGSVAESQSCAAQDSSGVFLGVPSQCLPPSLRLLGWDCQENCRYECMAENQRLRKSLDQPTAHYFGKWPFLRVFGVQEVFSSLFSLLNGLPHFLFLASGVPWRAPCKGQRDTPLWVVYAAVHVNTWLQSALFHARDTPLFEALDSHCATLGLAMNLAASIAMNLPEHWSMKGALCAALSPILACWALHIGYLSFVSFDYGHNMKVAVALGVSAGVSWLVWFLRHLDECRAFIWKEKRKKEGATSDPRASCGAAPGTPGLPPVLGTRRRPRAVASVYSASAVFVNASAYVCQWKGMRDNFIQKLTGTGADAAAAEKAKSTSSWVQYDLNTGETLYDIDFDQKDPSHGFVVGARGLFYETRDGGKRWVSRSFANLGKSEDIQYRFQTVSVRGNDVWIVGKPALLLHSKDSGKSWKKVPLSRKLPGIPTVIVALGDGKAELATTSGAVYQTENDGRNWKSQVKETVDATLNRVSASGVQGASYFTGSVKSIKRDPLTGKYLAVAQRGNFYLSFNPGEPRWVPHNRISARRIQ